MQWGPGDGSQGGGQGGFGGQPQQQGQPPHAGQPQQAWQPQQSAPHASSGFAAHLPPGVHVPSAAEAKGFFASLFDLSFSSYIIPTLLKVMYVITIIALVFGLLGMEFVAFTEQVIGEYGSALQGLLMMAFAPVVFFVQLLVVRMLYEWAFAAFRFVQALPEIAKKLKD